MNSTQLKSKIETLGFKIAGDYGAGALHIEGTISVRGPRVFFSDYADKPAAERLVRGIKGLKGPYVVGTEKDARF